MATKPIQNEVLGKTLITYKEPQPIKEPQVTPLQPRKLPGGHGATGAWDQDCHASFQGGTEPPEPGTKTAMQASRGARSHRSLGPRLPCKLPEGHGATGAWDQDYHASFQGGTEPPEPGTKTAMQASIDTF